jgi:hydroxymethylpyrimidine/phosphomethylpyrimidine kinase
MKIALTIAGSDPTGGAGLQADLKTFKSLGVYGIGILSVLTVQNTEGVHNIQEVPFHFFSEQMDFLLKDIQPDALKTGMLYSEDIIEIVAQKIREYSLKNLVVDPVTISSTGVQLIEERGLMILKNDLLPVARVITPNVYEAAALAGKEIKDEKDMKKAAVQLKKYGTENVIITGGHLNEKAVDLLFDGEDFLLLESEMLEGEYHGTGCVFSSVITACLALGYGIKEAFVKAKDFTYNAMKSANAIGKGMRILDI